MSALKKGGDVTAAYILSIYLDLFGFILIEVSSSSPYH
jgi:hypothetical protein